MRKAYTYKNIYIKNMYVYENAYTLYLFPNYIFTGRLKR